MNFGGNAMKINEELVSIIIPAYNVETYLCKCLDSLLKQTYRNIEVIIVDDGSTDNTGSICDDYSNKYSFVKVIHKANEGVSQARNDGIEIAHGTFLTFIDSDDFVEPDYIEQLYSGIIDSDTDLSITSYMRIYTNGKEIANSFKLKTDKYYSGKDLLIAFYRNKFNGAIVVWNKLYRVNNKSEFKFPKGLIFEDEYFSPRILYNAEKVYVNNLCKYHYLQRPGSITSELPEKRLLQLKSMENAIAFFQSVNNNELKFYAIRRYYLSILRLCRIKENTKLVELKKNTYLKYISDYKMYKRIAIKIFTLSNLFKDFLYQCKLKIKRIIK